MGNGILSWVLVDNKSKEEAELLSIIFYALFAVTKNEHSNRLIT